LAQALLAPEPCLAFLARRQSPGVPRHRHAQTAGVAGKAFFWLRSRAYLVTEYLPGPDIIERFAPYVENGDAPEAELQALDHLFAELIRSASVMAISRGTTCSGNRIAGR
jgi:hypothetical protein